MIAVMEKGYEETMAQNWVEQLRREVREKFNDSVSFTFREFYFPICSIHDWVDTPEGTLVWSFRDYWLDDVTGFRRIGWGKMCGRYEDFR